MHLIIDGDVLIYKGAFSAEIRDYQLIFPSGNIQEVKYKKEADDLLKSAPVGTELVKRVQYKEEGLARYYTKLAVEKILNRFPECAYTIYITAPGGYNYRYKVAKTVKYKHNRPERPKYYEVCRDYLLKKWNVVECKKCEADDAVAIKATELGMDCIIAHIDKDINQVPGTHYHIDRDEIYEVSELDGARSLYTQLLTGDTIDTIPGIKHFCPPRTCGDEQIKRILAGADSEYQLFAKAYRHAKHHSTLTKEQYREFFREQMELLRLPRTKEELKSLQEKYSK